MTPLPTISRVLVGVDFDEASASALKTAGALASAFNAGITVVHAAAPEAPAYFTAAQVDALAEEREQCRARTAEQVRAFVAQHLTGVWAVVIDERPPRRPFFTWPPRSIW